MGVDLVVPGRDQALGLGGRAEGDPDGGAPLGEGREAGQGCEDLACPPVAEGTLAAVLGPGLRGEGDALPGRGAGHVVGEAGAAVGGDDVGEDVADANGIGGCAELGTE